MAKAFLIIAAVIMLAGCSSTRTGSFCPLGPFIQDKGADERWTTDEQDQLIVLNETGEEICGWRPPSR